MLVHTFARRALPHTGILLAAAVGLSACTDPTVNLAGLDPVVVREPISLQNSQYCALDGDCDAGRFCMRGLCTLECDATLVCDDGQRCTDRGRCAADAATPTGRAAVLRGAALAAPATIPGVRVINWPAGQIHADTDATTFVLEIQSNIAVDQEILYYTERLDGTGGPTQALRAAGTDRFELQIPTYWGGADDAAPGLRSIRIVTSIGTQTLTVVPRPAVGGHYVGAVDVAELAGTLPLSLHLRLVPEDSTLETATGRFLALKNGDDQIFAPDGEDDAWVETALRYDAAEEVWYAVFASQYYLGNSQLFQHLPSLRRDLRVDIYGIYDTQLEGAIRDSWQGLFAQRSESGALISGNLDLRGDIRAVRADRAPLLPSERRGAVPTDQTVAPPPTAMPLGCGPDVLFPLLGAADSLVEGACGTAATLADVLTMDAAARATCIVTLADAALEAGTTSSDLLAFLDEGAANPQNLSFADYLEKCAIQAGVCLPNPAVMCARELSSYAYQTTQFQPDASAMLLDRFQALSNEHFLARQLAAYHVDTQSRLAWLRASIAPPFLGSQLRALNQNLLNQWEARVLAPHVEILAEQFSPTELDVLGRAPSTGAIDSTRNTLLLERLQTWQGTIEALEVAGRRWDDVLQSQRERRATSTRLRGYGLDLYLSAGMLATLNRSSGMGGLNAVFGPSLSRYLRTVDALELDFNEKLFQRDATVVVSTSVDPSSTNQTLLREREQQARRAISDAQFSVDSVIAAASQSDIQAATLTNAMRQQSLEMVTTLVALCGLPDGCLAGDIGVVRTCDVDVSAGGCGFGSAPDDLPISTETLNASAASSEAGQALLRMKDARLRADIAQNDLDVAREKARMEHATAAAFARTITDLDRARRSTARQVARQLQEMEELAGRQIVAELQALGAQQEMREKAYATQRQAVGRWDELRSDQADANITAALMDAGVATALEGIAFMSGIFSRGTNAVIEGLPSMVGVVTDAPAAATRFTLLTAHNAGETALHASRLALITAREATNAQRAMAENRSQVKLARLQDLHELNAVFGAQELARIAGELRAADLQSQAAIRQRETLIQTLTTSVENDIQYERELDALRQRQDNVSDAFGALGALQLQLQRAHIQTQQAMLDYLAIIQRAELIEAQRMVLERRLSSLESLLGSPSVIFAFSNQLLRAEERLDRARDLVLDWLIALEYHAVRPFADQRLAILLARNPSQLEAISDELLRVEQSCGGRVNHEQVELSLRSELLGLDYESLDEDNVVVSAAERFRAILRQGNTPADKGSRYGSDERIGAALQSESLLSITVPIHLDAFANLPLACNAKISGIDVQIVGEGIRDDARPVVNILYEGTSALRSCQPDVATIAQALGSGTTDFAPVTHFRTAGRTISPVAYVHRFGSADTENRGLDGLPLASTYTLLIDTNLPANQRIPWDQLEDIRLQFSYVYQDVFPEGQCR